MESAAGTVSVYDLPCAWHSFPPGTGRVVTLIAYRNTLRDLDLCVNKKIMPDVLALTSRWLKVVA